MAISFDTLEKIRSGLEKIQTLPQSGDDNRPELLAEAAKLNRVERWYFLENLLSISDSIANLPGEPVALNAEGAKALNILAAMAMPSSLRRRVRENSNAAPDAELTAALNEAFDKAHAGLTEKLTDADKLKKAINHLRNEHFNKTLGGFAGLHTQTDFADTNEVMAGLVIGLHLKSYKTDAERLVLCRGVLAVYAASLGVDNEDASSTQAVETAKAAHAAAVKAAGAKGAAESLKETVNLRKTEWEQAETARKATVDRLTKASKFFGVFAVEATKLGKALAKEYKAQNHDPSKSMMGFDLPHAWQSIGQKISDKMRAEKAAADKAATAAAAAAAKTETPAEAGDTATATAVAPAATKTGIGARIAGLVPARLAQLLHIRTN